MTKEIEKIIARFKKEVGKSKGMTTREMKLIEICIDELAMPYDALLCGVFLKELADKHGVDVTKLMVGKIGKELYVWRYDTGSYDVFKTLDIIPLNGT
jgi:hypothetical protein